MRPHWWVPEEAPMRPRCWVRRWWVRRSPPPWAPLSGARWRGAPPQRCAAAAHWTPCLSGARWRGWAAACPEPRCEPDVHRNMGILQRVSTPHGKIAMCFNATWEYCNDCYMFQHHIGNIATMATRFNATLQSEHRTRVQLRLCGWCWFSFGFMVGVGGLKGGGAPGEAAKGAPG